MGKEGNKDNLPEKPGVFEYYFTHSSPNKEELLRFRVMEYEMHPPEELVRARRLFREFSKMYRLT